MNPWLDLLKRLIDLGWNWRVEYDAYFKEKAKQKAEKKAAEAVAPAAGTIKDAEWTEVKTPPTNGQ